jgi:hypothetical protein
LVEDINDLFAPANKVPRGQLALLENIFESLAGSPAIQRQSKLCGEVSALGELVFTLDCSQL